MVDYSTLLYDPVYAEIGVPATLDAGTAGAVEITVIDDTRAKTNTSGTAEVRSVGPGAFARIPELAAKGITRDDYMGATITFNGRTWAVRSYEIKGSPNGEDEGEVRFFLTKVSVTEPSTDGEESTDGDTGPPPSGGALGLNKRSVLNMNILEFNRDNPFINFVKAGGFYYAFNLDHSLLDANGYATENSEIVKGKPFSVMLLPPSANYSGQYVLKWTGTGQVWLDQSYNWTIDSGTGYTEIAEGKYSGTNPRIVITPGSLPEASGGFSLLIAASDPSNVGDYLRDLRFYMIGDETDLNAGKVFRAGWKQTILDLNPGCIRPLNWTGGSASLTSNWSSQIGADCVSYISGWAGLVPYGLGAVNSTTNAITVSSATGMPVTMKHGEIVAIGLSGSATVNWSKRTITGITNANPGVVTAYKDVNYPELGHGFTTGQRVIFNIGAGGSPVFHQLHFKVCTITVLTPSTFSIGVNTTTFGTFVAGAGGVPGWTEPGFVVSEYLGMNVGARGEYPVCGLNGLPITLPSGCQFLDDGYTHFVFDKYLVGNRDTGPGAWVCYNASATAAAYVPHQPGVPLEACVALVNELTEMKGEGGAINLWITTPPRAMMSVDPDYTAAENWPVKAVDRCLNGNGSWDGLNAASALLVEFSNETWNAPFTGTGYLCRCGQLRYDAGGGATPFTESASDINSFGVIRSMVMCQDLATAYPTEIASGRVIRIAAGQGTYGINVGGTGVNEDRVWANAKVLADAWNVGGTDAYEKFEAFAWASYFDATEGSSYPWYDAHFTDYVADFVAAAGDPVEIEAICADWVTLGVRPAGEGTTAYGVKGLQFDTVLGDLDRAAVQYEGGYDWWTATSVSPPRSADEAAFMTALQRSAAWAAEQKAFFELWNDRDNSYHPAIYIQTTNDRWGYNRPYFNNYAGTDEGGALNLTWAAMGEYNDSVDEVPTA